MIKEKGSIPLLMRKANISTIPKKGKSRLHLQNERGIFLVNIIRGIFMRILYNRKSKIINMNMSDSNVGGRKDINCINHVWVVNGVIHKQLSSVKNLPIVLEQYDYTQMFDGMNLKEALSDLYSTGVQDDTLEILYQANKSVAVRVKTPFGLTDEVTLDEVVLQGEVWGPILASNQVDMFGKEMLQEDYSFMYRYKGFIPVPVLGQIEDTGLAGYKAAQFNSYMNVKSSDKYPQLGHEKCKAMVICKKIDNFHIPKLQVNTWKTHHTKEGDLIDTFGGKKDMEVCKELTYLGVEISADGKNMKTLLRKRNKNIGKTKQI